MRVLTAAQMREADRQAIHDIGIPSVVLMENAGRQVVAAMDHAFADLDEARVAILAGRGNNGGDGFVVARVLAQRNVDVDVYLLGAPDEVRGDARLNLDILARLGIEVVELRSATDWELHGAHVLSADLIIDAIFGTGLSAPLSGLAETIVDDVNDADVPVVAVDLPSGLSADTSEPIGSHILATLTVTLGAPKYPLVLPPSQHLCGSLVVADIGIPREVIEGLDGPVVETIDAEDVRGYVPERHPDAHKGTFGHVLVVAGSRGMTGAAHLAAMGALRAGAGLVTIATPASCAPIVASLGPEYMTVPLEEDAEGAVRASAIARILRTRADVVAIGPGLGTGEGAAAILEELLSATTCPLVIDADALTALPRVAHLLAAHPRPVVITPHPGEMARLTNLTIAEVQRDRLSVARAAAERLGLYVVLKGHRTVVATPDGRVAVNGTGNAGMATGGSGDVLTGILAACLGQMKQPEQACCLAVHVHGSAGDLAAADVGEVGLTAGDIVRHTGRAFLSLVTEHASGEGHDHEH